MLHSILILLGLGKVLVKRWKRWFRKNKDYIRVCDEDEETNEANRLPDDDLSAIAENGEQDSSIPTLEQQSFAGGTPVVPSSLADLPFADLDIDAMLEEFDDSATHSIAYNHEEEQANHLPDLMLSAVAENGRQDSGISAQKQQSSASVPSGLADLPFAELNIDTMLECNDSATPRISHNLEDEQTQHEYCLSEGTLSTFAENGQQDSSIPALEQHSFTGGTPVVPSGLADVPCADLDIDAALEELDDSAASDMSHSFEEEQTDEVNRLPDGTLSAFIETGQPKSSIPVRKQQSHAGSRLVIPSALANLSCAKLGVDAVFVKLNTILGTSHKLTASASSVLELYIARNDDLGTVYGHLRKYWADSLFPHIDIYTRAAEEELQQREQKLLVNGRIWARHTTGCRRIWDLYANRVVPFMAGRSSTWGISHAWVDARDRVDVWTPINRREWPVPVPKDANLDLIRIEMLNLGAEYAWLDVLCLRQEGGPREDLRVQEWKTDVPTIGWVYLRKRVVCYFCGLGQPLRLKLGYFEDDRCWFKRAWTLQEISQNTIIGGETGDDGTLAEDVQVMLREQVESLQKMRESRFMFDVLSEMKKRVSTKSLDKVAGLGYILDLTYLPIYDGSQSEEEAWAALVDAMSKYSRWDLFFLYPEPGDGSKCWRPSWNQIMTKILPSHPMSLSYVTFGESDYLSTDDSADSYQGYHIDSGYVEGLSHPSYNGMPRQGQLVVKDGSTYTFKIVADHTYPIPEGSYTLLFQWDTSKKSDYYCRQCFVVVGRQRPDGKFEKLSVFRMLDDDEGTLFLKLGIKKYASMVLC
ncbi:uncharacterized protein ARMOST_20443 [Armillaria ostoyae]|uniref:Heterokaryon incompatibility domain-containing protein n=1 Tax=Armillaria ostoyae TaxID=47428 RepID=A0A284S7C9_ARMOS|nr:uncharacterized protein ARMOST_20443 [Armillaria ostoyae]